MIRTALRLFVACSLAVYLAGCQSVRQPFPNGELQADYLSHANEWRAEGKIAVKLDGTSHSASFQWTQKNQNYRIHLFGPFGQGTTWLKRDASGVTLESAETGKRSASNPEDLMQETLGWQVPISNLQHWIKGLVAPLPPPDRAEVDSLGFLSQLQQEGWQVSYSRYHNVRGWWLPGKIIAQRDTMRLVVIIKKWRMPSAPRNHGLH